jgi:hypothetical protein
VLSSLPGDTIPPAAYSALTASSKLQYLTLRGCALPADPWQYLFPNGRQLPHLRSLDMPFVRAMRVETLPPPPWDPAGPQQTHLTLKRASAPGSSRLASCCPSLQHLDITGLESSVTKLRLLSQLPNVTRLTYYNSDSNLRAALGQTCPNIAWDRPAQ